MIWVEFLTTLMLGEEVDDMRMTIWTKVPVISPISTLTRRPMINVSVEGSRSMFLPLNSLTGTEYSMVKNMAKMMTAERAEVGMKARKGLRKAQVRMMMIPVMTPPKGVLTPDVEFTADLPKLAVTAAEPVKDPMN